MGNLILVLIGTFLLGFGLIFLLALAEKRTASSSVFKTFFLHQESFEKACVEMIERMKLNVEDVQRPRPNELDILAVNPAPFIGGDLIVHCAYIQPEEVIGPAAIIELSNMVIQSRLTKAILITTGKFTDEKDTLGELAPMEFLDGKTFQGLIEKYKIQTAG